MPRFQASSLAVIIAGTLSMFPNSSAQAFDVLADDHEHVFEEENPFGNAEPVPDAALAEMRGGYVFGELTIDFGLVSSTYVDGTLVNETAINSTDAQDILADGIKTIIQVGDQNAVLDSGILDTVPGLVTVIQNNTNDTIIQQIDIVEIEATGLQDFELQALNPLIEFQNTNAL